MLNKKILPLLLSLALTACGFHLRGPLELPALLKSTSISGIAKYSPLNLELSKALINAGAKVVSATDKPLSIIVIGNEQYNRRILSVDAQGRAAEYGLIYSFNFEVTNAAGKQLVPWQKIELNRDFRFDPNAVLAKDTEEAQIHSDMIKFAVRQMIRRVDASLKQSH